MTCRCGHRLLLLCSRVTTAASYSLWLLQGIDKPHSQVLGALLRSTVLARVWFVHGQALCAQPLRTTVLICSQAHGWCRMDDAPASGEGVVNRGGQEAYGSDYLRRRHDWRLLGWRDAMLRAEDLLCCLCRTGRHEAGMQATGVWSRYLTSA